MKKICCIVLSFILIFQFASVSFANTSSGLSPIVSATIPLATSDADIDAMGKLGLEKILSPNKAKATPNNLSISNSYLELKFTKFVQYENKSKVSGDCTAIIDGKTMNFPFYNNPLDTVDISTDKKLYVGVLESSIVIDQKSTPVLIDVVSNLDFSKVVASVSIGILENDPTILFFGETFPEYDAYVQQYFDNSVSDATSSTNGTPEKNYTKVTININPTYASTADLPSSLPYSSAKTNAQNGAMCKIKYDSMGSDDIYNGSVTVSGQIQYRVYIGTNHRISTLVTGPATITHSIFNR